MIEKMKIGSKGRLLSNVLSRKLTPFHALKELINNSLWANAKCITISLKEQPIPSTLFTGIGEIEVVDDGHGVPYSDFRDTIMTIATDKRTQGMGVGRFTALQIGRLVEITTVAYDSEIKKYTKTRLALNATNLEIGNLDDMEFEVEHDEIEEEKTYYKVSITSLYNYEQDCPKRCKLGKDFNRDVLARKVFENYPEYIYKDKVRFNIWGKDIVKADYCQGEPVESKTSYTDAEGKEHDIFIKIITLRLKNRSSKIFLQGAVNGITNTVAEFSYSSNWINPEEGTHLIYVQSEVISEELCNNFSLEGFGQKDWALFQTALKDELDRHFKDDGSKYATFIQKLMVDRYYPFDNFVNSASTSSLPANIFNRIAYIMESNQKLLANDDPSRGLIYSLLKKVIEDGNMRFLVEKVVNLKKDNQKRLLELLDITDLDSIVKFSSEIVLRKSIVENVHNVVSNTNKETVELRKTLASMLLRHIWLLSEHYQSEQFSLIDQHLADTIDTFYCKHLSYSPKKKMGNILEDCPKNRKSIPNQYICEERLVGYDKKEILFIDVRAPHFMLTKIERGSFDSFAFELEKSSDIPKTGYCYRLYMIGNEIDEELKSTINSSRMSKENPDSEPFFYNQLNSNGKDIRLYILTWQDLFHLNEAKLTTQSKLLEIRSKEAQEKFIKNYNEYLETKSKSVMKISK